MYLSIINIYKTTYYFKNVYFHYKFYLKNIYKFIVYKIIRLRNEFFSKFKQFKNIVNIIITLTQNKRITGNA